MEPRLLEQVLYNGTTWLVLIGGGIALAGAIYWHRMSPAQRLNTIKQGFGLLVVASLAAWVGYQQGEAGSAKAYRFLNYIDGLTLETAKDMQAMCDQRSICKAEEIRTRWEDATGVGKVQAGLR